ncbi:uncharacterized protein LOC119593320 [Penaeus monodon]|uniref:uncharacterized protein LOC119593320 n=1 Tax=Penaeus monodon TaxID=6687 RepID=UPI0018A7AF63|nr:uncharacterized protein LOC119593320 [Penaeus monodon]
MAAQGTFFAALLLCLSAVTLAKEETPESRLFFSSENTSATLPMSSIMSIGALAVGLLVLVAIFTFIGGETKEAVSYAAPTSYAAPAPSYGNEESSYSVLRSINEASDRYQWEHQ